MICFFLGLCYHVSFFRSSKSEVFLAFFCFFLFPNLFKLLAFICISLHPSSNSRTDFEDNLALRIARIIAVSISIIKEYTLMSSSSDVVDVKEGSLASSSVSVFVNAGISILVERSRMLDWLSIVRIVHLDRIS